MTRERFAGSEGKRDLYSRDARCKRIRRADFTQLSHRAIIRLDFMTRSGEGGGERYPILLAAGSCDIYIYIRDHQHHRSSATCATRARRGENDNAAAIHVDEAERCDIRFGTREKRAQGRRRDAPKSGFVGGRRRR